VRISHHAHVNLLPENKNYYASVKMECRWRAQLLAVADGNGNGSYLSRATLMTLDRDESRIGQAMKTYNQKFKSIALNVISLFSLRGLPRE
jgi:hypothetical protein